MLSGPTIASYKKVEGYATPMSVLLSASAVIIKSVDSVKFSIVAQSKAFLSKFNFRQVEKKGKCKSEVIDVCHYCDLPCHVKMIVKMTVNVTDVHGAGSVRTKLRPMHWVKVRYIKYVALYKPSRFFGSDTILFCLPQIYKQ